MDLRDPNRVRLVIGGVEYSGWLGARIEAGIERAARSFSLEVTTRWPGSDLVRRVAPGDECEVWIGSDKVVTGYVDAAPVAYDGGQVQVQVAGRSRTADLVDCSAINEPGQWRGLRVEAVAGALAGVYGVSVVARTDTGPAMIEHQIEPGETVWESVDRMLTLRQLLATDDELGRLVLIGAGDAGQASGALEFGKNILRAAAQRDRSQTYSEYVCKAQRATVEQADEDVGTFVTEPVGIARQTGVSRRRVLVLRESGQADAEACAARAQYELAYRDAKARQVRYTLNGWRQPDGSLWRVNQLVRVIDDVIGINEQLLAVEVAYSLSSAGMLCELLLAPQAGYVKRLQRQRSQAKALGRGGAAPVSWADVK